MMSVIAELQLPAASFELGRALSVNGSERVELETMVPVQERYVPYLWVYDGVDDGAGVSAANSDVIRNLQVVDDFEDRTLYALEWHGERDVLMRGITEHRAQLLKAVASGDTWALELRFPSHDSLSSFQRYCEENGLNPDLQRVYNPTKPESAQSQWYGLTERQREALLLAVERGYYDIPRATSTVEIANELGISDQAVTERLRRAIRTLTENTLLATDEE